MDTMRERFTAVTSHLLDEDPRLAVVLAEIGADGFRDAAARHPDRVVNVGIREQLLVGVGGGLALTGMRPVMHTFASFLVERPFEQVKLDLGHQGAAGVLVSANASYDWPAGGFTHMSPGDVALLDTLEGWTVHVPGHPDEAETLLRHAYRTDERVYVRLSLQSNGTPRPVSPDGFLTLRRGSAQAPVVVAVGPLLDATVAALAGVDATVLYATTVRPFDHRALRAAVAGRTAADVVLVEPYLRGTSSAAVAEALHDTPHRLLALGTAREELRRYGQPADHLRAHGLDAAGLRKSITAFAGRSPAAD
ncbi:transketolase family protein [Streptomyces alkaliterrae]|uniref:Transketolase n=1 Tax=Streptomyces alkaliterrae TaxID=2213162 RepID=A0A5P0YRV7_9ACTN|nr:transketolase [Streptomyces alkaliterrae]MBB1252939.1 transketolase [Streptomyces alkaliterrae]MBB1258366.1 transketolase [Streptomyces alkaliterrae]MQS02337.1 transketolase [Streptomyces alkaliterrae]